MHKPYAAEHLSLQLLPQLLVQLLKESWGGKPLKSEEKWEEERFCRRSWSPCLI